ncbi:hypothetical protein MPS_5242 [Mycobacterium pseudoshottsii JCM 15466]|nr:hypothetical protein MPS_5242 [Mycobacterium pseudoshottsii JCM 15466]
MLGLLDAELFQDGDRRTTVRNPEEQDAHGSITWPAPLRLEKVNCSLR